MLAGIDALLMIALGFKYPPLALKRALDCYRNGLQVDEIVMTVEDISIAIDTTIYVQDPQEKVKLPVSIQPLLSRETSRAIFVVRTTRGDYGVFARLSYCWRCFRCGPPMSRGETDACVGRAFLFHFLSIMIRNICPYQTSRKYS